MTDKACLRLLVQSPQNTPVYEQAFEQGLCRNCDNPCKQAFDLALRVGEMKDHHFANANRHKTTNFPIQQEAAITQFLDLIACLTFGKSSEELTDVERNQTQRRLFERLYGKQPTFLSQDVQVLFKTLFHALWSNAVNSPEYNKKLWQDMVTLLYCEFHIEV